MENNKYLIIFHNEDNDGLFSCAITKCYLINELKVNDCDIDLFPTTYNKLNKLYEDDNTLSIFDKYNKIIMCDISFNLPNAMKYIYFKFKNNFIWIDHHLVAIKLSYKYKYDNMLGIRDTTRSALLQTYKYFYDPFDINYNDNLNKNVNICFLKALSGFDNFNYNEYGFDLNTVLAINNYILVSLNLDINKIYTIIYNLLYINNDIDINDLIVKGDLINKSNEFNYKIIIDNYGDLTWKIKDNDIERTACAIFYSAPTSSIMFKSLINKVDNGIVFKKNKDDTWTISLYNINPNDTFNCGSFLNKKYKTGGGHICAAGFTIKNSKISKILKLKIL